MRTSRVALISIALFACKREQPAPPAAPPPAPARAAPAPLAEAPVKAVLDEWLAAQNAGSFERYQKLYAARFQGVRRSGPRTVRLDRAGWVADRKRMFGKPMTVELAELELVRNATMARAQFQQTWASGNYKDVGRKQMVIVREGEGLRIAREELLESRIVGADHRDLSDALMIADDTGVVLSTTPDEGWSKGAIRAGKGDFTSVRSVDVGALPAALAGWHERKVRLMGQRGPLCEGTVSGFSMIGRVTPHFGAVQEWQGTNGEKWSPDRIAAELWTESAGDGRLLVGDLANKCAGALWAFDAEKTTPVVAAADKLSPGPLLDASLRALRRLPLHAEIQKTWLAFPEGDKGPWSASPNVATVAWRFDHPRATLVMVSSAWGGCSEFGGDLTAIFRLNGGEASPKLTLLSAMSYGDVAAPLSAFDLDGDGNLEILFGPEGLRQERGLYQLSGDAYDRFVLTLQPYHDCPC